MVLIVDQINTFVEIVSRRLVRDYDINFCINYLFSGINECEYDPCENDGGCEDLEDGYNCICVAGYGGTNCETSKACI